MRNGRLSRGPGEADETRKSGQEPAERVLDRLDAVLFLSKGLDGLLATRTRDDKKSGAE